MLWRCKIKLCTYKNKYVPFMPIETCMFTSRPIFGPLCMLAAPNILVDLWILPPALFKIKKVKGLEIFIYWTAHFSYSFIKKHDKKLIILEKLPFSESTVKILLFGCFKYLTFILFCSATLYKVLDFSKKNGLEDKRVSDGNKGSLYKQL